MSAAVERVIERLQSIARRELDDRTITPGEAHDLLAYIGSLQLYGLRALTRELVSGSGSNLRFAEGRERLRAWSMDEVHVVRSVRTHEPIYANPGELRADVRGLLALCDMQVVEIDRLTGSREPFDWIPTVELMRQKWDLAHRVVVGGLSANQYWIELKKIEEEQAHAT